MRGWGWPLLSIEHWTSDSKREPRSQASGAVQSLDISHVTGAGVNTEICDHNIER